MTAYLPSSDPTFPPFAECLKSLPNLHTLKIGWLDNDDGNSNATSLTEALNGVELPQIKTLILPPDAYPLLQHCCDVEDVVCVVDDRAMSPDGFLESLTSKRDPKVKRLAIPLVLWANLSSKRFSTLWGHGMGMMTIRLRT